MLARELGSKVYNRYITQRKLRSRQLEKVQEVYEDYIHLLAKDSQVDMPGRGGVLGPEGYRAAELLEMGQGSLSTSQAQGLGSGNLLLQRPSEPVRPLGEPPAPWQQAGQFWYSHGYF